MSEEPPHDDEYVTYLSPEAWKRLLEILAEPPKPNPALRELLTKPAPWDRD